jgi:hypothetical protein
VRTQCDRHGLAAVLLGQQRHLTPPIVAQARALMMLSWLGSKFSDTRLAAFGLKFFSRLSTLGAAAIRARCGASSGVK